MFKTRPGPCWPRTKVQNTSWPRRGVPEAKQDPSAADMLMIICNYVDLPLFLLRFFPPSLALFFFFLPCSILNKLTPEKFDKLCLELLNVGVDSKLVLKGIILLVSLLSSVVVLRPTGLCLSILAGRSTMTQNTPPPFFFPLLRL